MNLLVLNKSMRVPDSGDVFVMQPPDGDYLFGRLINKNSEIGPIKNCLLIYIYKVRAANKAPIPELRRDQLLGPPIMTNRLPWTKGYFEHLENQPFAMMDRLPQHCFKDTRGWYFDEYSKRLPGPVAPVGEWGLDSFRTIDDKVSEALGIPLAPSD